jgi:hypothetical protein
MLKAIGLALVLVSLFVTVVPSEAKPSNCHHAHHGKGCPG